MIAVRVHLFPSLTQKFSSLAPTILGGRLPGKIGNANTESQENSWLSFFMPATVPRTVADGMTILGLPRKIGNANTTSQANAWLFFYPP